MRRSSDNGSLFILSLFVLVGFVSLLSVGLVRTLSDVATADRIMAASQAFQLAEGGIDQAACNLRTPTDPSDDLVTVGLPSGTFTLDTPVPLGNLQWRVHAHGLSNADAQVTRQIEAVVQLKPQSVFQFALFGDDTINVTGSAITNSYDSRLGPYNDDPHSAGYNVKHHGDIGTNTTLIRGVTFGGSIFIDGQVAVGANVADPIDVIAGYDPAFITGGTSPPSDMQDVVSQPKRFVFPTITVPTELTCSDFTVQGNTTQTLPAGTYCYRNLTIEGNGMLTVEGKVTIYLTGELIARGNSVLGTVTNPASLQILMAPGTEATLEEGIITGSNQFYGGLYGPEATINISGNAIVFGSIMAKVINVTGSAEIHYDEALTQLTDITNEYRSAVIAWREIPATESPAP